MVYKQPAMGAAILWGDGLSGRAPLSKTTSAWSDGDCVGSTSILQTTISKWFNLRGPESMTDSNESTLAFGEIGHGQWTAGGRSRFVVLSTLLPDLENL